MTSILCVFFWKVIKNVFYGFWLLIGYFRRLGFFWSFWLFIQLFKAIPRLNYIFVLVFFDPCLCVRECSRVQVNAKVSILRSILKRWGRVCPEGIWATHISLPAWKYRKCFYNGNGCWSIEFYHLTSRLSLSSKLRGREGGGGGERGMVNPQGRYPTRSRFISLKSVFYMVNRESLQLWLFNPLQVKIGHVVALSLNTGVCMCV